MAINVGELEAILRLKDEMSAKLREATGVLNKFGADASTISDKLQKFGSTATAAGSALSIGVTAPIVAAAGASVYFSSQFGATMVKLHTLAGVLSEDMTRVKDHILDLAPAVGIGPQALALAMTKVSSTVADTSVALNILDIAAKGSAAGLGEAVDVAGALTSVINSYGATNITAARAGDILTQAIKDGGAEAKELAPTLANVVPFAAAMGISFEEVAANIATMTKLGVPASEAVTSLTSVMTAMNKPSKEGEEALAKMGQTFGMLRQEIKDKGLAATLIDLQTRFAGNSEELIKIFGRVEGFKNILGTAASQAETYTQVLKKMGEASKGAGVLQEAFNEITKTTEFSLKSLSAQVGVIAVRFGDALAPMLAKVVGMAKPLLDKILELAEGFGKLDPVTQGVIVGAVALVAAIGPVLLVLGSLAQGLAAVIGLGPAMAGAWAMITGPIGLTVIAVAAVAAGLVYFASKSEYAGILMDMLKIAAYGILAPFRLLFDIAKSLAEKIDLVGVASNIAAAAVAYVLVPFTALGFVMEKASDAARVLLDTLGLLKDTAAGDAFNQAAKGVENFGKASTEGMPLTADLALALMDADDALKKVKDSSSGAALMTDKQREAAEKQKKALEELATYSLNYADTLATVNSADQTMISTLLEHGATVAKIAEAYPRLSTAQIESVNKGVEAEKKRVEELAKANEEIVKLQEDAADAIEALDADTLANRIKHLEAKGEREYAAAIISISTVEEQVKAILAIEMKYDALGVAEQRKAADEKNKIIMAGAMLYLRIVKTNADAAFNLTATDREKSLRAIQQNEIEKLEEIRQKTFESTGLRKLAEDEVRKGSTASVAALKIDNAALTANSKQHFIEVAERSRATYDEMKAHPEKYSKETIEEFKKIAEQTEEPVKGVGVKWKEGFKDIAASIPGIVTQAMTSGGGIVGAMKGIGVMAGAKLGEMLGKSLSGLGSMAGPIGAAIGSLAGPLIEMFTKMLDFAAKGIKQTAASYGVTIGDEMAQAIKASMKSNDLTQAAATVFNAIKLFPTIDTTNIDKALKITHDAFSMIETKQLSVAQGGKVVNDMFDKMKAAGTSASGLISKGLLEIIQLNDRFGTNAASIGKFVTEQTTSAIGGLTTFLTNGTIATQAAATSMSAAVVASFTALQKHGMSVTEALKAVQPVLAAMENQLVATGFTGGVAFQGLQKMAAMAADKIAGPALDAVSGLNQAMKGLHNAGLMDQEMFVGLAGQITATFQTLVKQGHDGTTAMQLMQPSLQTVWELQKDFGYAVDEGTQALIDQAVEAGIVGEKHQDVQKRILDVLERIAKVFGADLPAATDAAARSANDAAERIQDDLNGLHAPSLEITLTVGDVDWPEPPSYGSGGGGGDDTGYGEGYAHGGIVRGYANGTDSVPAMLTPGEAVLTTGAAGRLGSATINRLNSGMTLSNEDVVNELRALRRQQAASDRQLPLLVAISVRDAMQLKR